MTHRYFAALILAALALTGPPAFAAITEAPTPCVTVSDIARIVREADPDVQITLYRGIDGRAFITALDTLFGSHPPPIVLMAVTVGVYASQYVPTVALRFFDAMGCDVGQQGGMTPDTLQKVLRHIGTGT